MRQGWRARVRGGRRDERRVRRDGPPRQGNAAGAGHRLGDKLLRPPLRIAGGGDQRRRGAEREGGGGGGQGVRRVCVGTVSSFWAVRRGARARRAAAGGRHDTVTLCRLRSVASLRLLRGAFWTHLLLFVEPSPRVGCFGSTREEGSVDAGVVQSLSNGDTDAETVELFERSSSRSRARRVGLFSYATRAPRRHTRSLNTFADGYPLFISDSSLHFRDVTLAIRSANIQRNKG